MKNIIHEVPTRKVSGRLKFAIDFLDNNHIFGKDVLDIGCGFGWFELVALEEGANTIVGIEPTEKDLLTARENIRNKKIILELGTATTIPLKDNSVDTIVSWEVIEHIPVNMENFMFKECYRVLRKDGHFYISTVFDHPASKFLDPAYWLIGHRHYSLPQLRSFAESNGFEILDVKIVGAWWSLLGLLNMYFSKWILRRRRLFDKFFINKVDAEFERGNGFMSIFVKMKRFSERS